MKFTLLSFIVFEVLKEKDKEIEDLYFEIGARERKETDMDETTNRLSRNLQRIEAEKSKAAQRLSTASQELSLKEKKLLDLEKEKKDLEEQIEELKESKKKLKLDLKVKTKEGEAKDLEIKEKVDEIERLTVSCVYYLYAEYNLVGKDRDRWTM